MLPLHNEDYNWIPYRTVKTTQLPVDIPQHINNYYGNSYRLELLNYYLVESIVTIATSNYPVYVVDFTYFELLAGCLLERDAAYYEAAGISLSKEHIYFLDVVTTNMHSYDIKSRINNMAAIRSIMNVQYYIDNYTGDSTLNKCVRRVPILNSIRQKPVLLSKEYAEGLIRSVNVWLLERIVEHAQSKVKNTSKYAPSSILGCHVKLNARYFKPQNNPYVDMYLKLKELYEKAWINHETFRRTASSHFYHVHLTTLAGKTLTTHDEVEKYLFDTQLNLVLKDILFNDN